MKAVIYARYSSDSQREESIEGQLRECKEYADRQNLTIIGTYIDRALSARSDDRPEFQRMVRDSAKKQFEVVLVWKLDRFSRNRSDSAMYKVILKRNGVRVVSAKENISEGPEGIILESLLEGMAEYYSAELSQKVRRGQTENALKCKYNGGFLPLGYKVSVDRMYEIDPLTAPIVQEIFERYATGETVEQIGKSLNQRRLFTNMKYEYTNKSTMHNLLKNRRYIGEYKYSESVTMGGIPAIITPELFDKVQARMEKNKHAPAASKATDEYILTTKLFCGHDGVYMVGTSGTSKTGRIYYYYKCGNTIYKKTCSKKPVRKEWIERLIVAQTKEWIMQDDVINRLADAIVEMQKKENTVIPMLKNQLQEVEKGIENMLNAIQQGIINASTKQRLDDLETHKADIEISIAKEMIQKPSLTHEQIVFWISKFKDGDTDNPVYRKSIIDIFLNSAYLYDDKLILTYNYKDGTKTVSLSDIESSDIDDGAPPQSLEPQRVQGFSMLENLTFRQFTLTFNVCNLPIILRIVLR